jgi:hypothetical protein
MYRLALAILQAFIHKRHIHLAGIDTLEDLAAVTRAKASGISVTASV